MNRRDFFKFPAVVALMAAVPPLAKVAAAPVFEEAMPIAAAPVVATVVQSAITGFVREILAYDIRLDTYMVRWDIGDGKEQYDITYMTNEEDDGLTKEEFLIAKREEAVTQLKKYAESKGMNMEKLIKLQLPPGANHARYV